MTFNNLSELFSKKEELISKQYSYLLAIEESKKEQKKGKRENKAYWKSVIKNYKEMYDNYQEEINKLDNQFRNSLSYPKEIFTPFVLECINLNEDEKYISRSLVLSPVTHFISSAGIPLYNHYDIIFPENILEEEIKLEKSFYISSMYYSYQKLFENLDVKNAIFPTEGYQSLITESLNLLKFFEDFPYLKDIGMDLIDRRLREPDKKLVEILNDEIAELRENKYNKNLCK